MSRPPDEKEVELLKKFRVAIKDCVPERCFRNDSYLLRWLRARDHNLEKAEQMLRNSRAWRKEFGTDLVLAEPVPKEFDNYFACAFGGIDKEGRPVLGVPFGDWDLRNMLDAGKKDEILRFLAQCLEVVDSTMQEMWNNNYPFKSLWPHTQFTVIFDMAGFTYSKMMHKKSIECTLETIKIYEAHYPETLGKAIVINAPRIFSILFGMIKPLLSAHTVSKIAIYDSKESEWKKAVLEVMDADQIPARYGGIQKGTRPI